MKEEDLTSKLENLKLPEVELPSHKSQLKMALLKERHSASVAELVRTKIKGGGYIMRGILISKQPVWRTALVSVLATVLVAGLSTIPSLARQSNVSLAEEIVKNSSEVMEALNGEEISDLNVVHIKDNMATVLVAGASPFSEVMVDVDLLAKRVIQIFILPLETYSIKDEQERILRILEADPRTKTLLEKGAVIDTHGMIIVSVFSSEIVEGTGLKISEGISDREAKFWINLGDKRYFAHVDLIQEKILWFGDTDSPEYIQKTQPPSLP